MAGEHGLAVLVDGSAPGVAFGACLDAVRPAAAAGWTVLVHGGERVAGFGWAADANEAASTGEVLLFVNGAVVVRPGAIDAGLAALTDGVGAVTGRLLRPDGALAEAGGIVWADGSIGVYAPPHHEQTGWAMFRRDVDWGSRRLLMVRWAAFEAAGGFTAGFEGRAACDAELCERIWAAGWRVVFEPGLAGVLQGGADEIAASLADQKRLRAGALARPARVRYPADAVNELAARDASGRRKRVLVADGVVPLKAVGAGYPRTQAILNEAVAMGWAVTFLAVNAVPIDWAAARAELAPEIEITAQGAVINLAGFLRARRGHYDVVMVSRPENMGAFLQVVRADPDVLGGARLVYDAEALFAGRAVQAARLRGEELPSEQVEAMIREELAQTGGADAVVAVTPAEAAVFRERLPIPVSVVSHLVEPRQGPLFEARSGFLFVGRLLEPGSPNWEGLAWFVRSVWPLIRAELGDVVLDVVGALHPNAAELHGPGVVLHGSVGDLRPHYDRVRLFVSPTRYAAGVSIKVLEAVEAGVPVLTTTLIAGQLGWTPGVELLATDDAGAMAFQSIAPYRLPAVWAGLRDSASARLEAEHGRARFRAGLQAAWGG